MWQKAIIKHGHIIIGDPSWQETKAVVDIHKDKSSKIILAMYQSSLEIKSIPQKKLVMGEHIRGSIFTTRRINKGTWYNLPVAIKSTDIKQTSFDKLKSELNIISTIKGHRSLLRCYGYCITSKAFHLITEFMPLSMAHILKDKTKKLPWRYRWQWAMDIGAGLSYLHTHRIIHRNLKSSVILINKQNQAKISNFGLAKQLTSSREKYERKVKVFLWTAPELLLPSPKIMSASDIYAYGIVLWEIVARKRPFEDACKTSQLALWVHCGKRDEIPTSCPKAYADVIQKCWAQDPKKRPSAKEALNMLTTGRKNDHVNSTHSK